MGSLTEAFALSQGNARIDAKGIAQSAQNGSGSGNVRYSVDTSGLQKVMQHMLVNGKRTAKEVVRYVMLKVLMNARSNTKLGQKERKTSGVSGPSGAEQQEKFLVYQQGRALPREVLLPNAHARKGEPPEAQQRRFLIRQSLIQRYTKIARVGLAKSSWGWAIKKSCGSMSPFGPPPANLGAKEENYVREGGRTDPVEVHQVETPERLSITIENKLGWIEKAHPGIAQQAVNKVQAQLQAQIDGKWKKKLMEGAA